MTTATVGVVNEDSSDGNRVNNRRNSRHLAPPQPAALKARRFTLTGMRDPLGLRPSAVDVYSRLLFPAAFTVFQILYWSYSLFSVEDLPDDIILLHRH